MRGLLIFTLAAWGRAWADGADFPSLPATRRAYQTHTREALARVTGSPRLRPRTPTRMDFERMTCRELDALLRTRGIPGRSKARRRAQKLALLTRLP